MKYRMKEIAMLIYCLLVLAMWPFRWKVLGLIPVESNNFVYPAFRMIAEVSYWVIALSFLVAIYRVPGWYARKVNQAIEGAGLHNATDEYPTFKRVKKDRNKEHGLIVTLKNCGLSPVDVDNRVHQLGAALNAHIYAIEYGRKTSRLLIYLLPHRFASPTVISENEARFASLPNLAIIGATGTGKTVGLKVILSSILHQQPSCKLWVLDFKAYDFKFLSGTPGYYCFSDCFQGLQDFYNAFKAQQETGNPGEHNWLVIDEWASFLLSLEKRQREQAISMLGELLMLTRAYNYHVICSQQRADATYFGSSRDNFKAVIGMGNLRRESKQMMFSSVADQMTANCKTGEGYMLIDGEGLERIKIAEVKDMGALDDKIRRAMSRPPCEA